MIGLNFEISWEEGNRIWGKCTEGNTFCVVKGDTFGVTVARQDFFYYFLYVFIRILRPTVSKLYRS
jgi:hypothetical protein